MGTILVLFAVVLYVREVRDRLKTFDDSLYTTSQIMISGVEAVNYGGQQQIDLEDVPLLGNDSQLLNVRLTFARWYTPEQRILQFFGTIPPSDLEGAIGFSTLSIPESATRLRQLTLPVYQRDRLLGYLQIAASLDPVSVPLRRLRVFLSLGVPATLAIIAVAGWWLGGEAMQPIRQSYQKLQQFTSAAAHELRSPLAGIISNAQVGLMEPIDPDEQTTRLTTISTVAGQMSNLVNQLLFLARHEGVLTPDVLQTVDALTVIQDSIQPFYKSFQDKQLTFHMMLPTDAAADPIYVAVHPELIKQAIANLLTNAQRYTPAGGTITVTLTPYAKTLLLTVADNGIGIDAEDLPHIFDRFYRVDTVRSRYTGGFGLGLAIVQQIIEAHQGTITVTSELNIGSTFKVSLPRAISIHT